MRYSLPRTCALAAAILLPLGACAQTDDLQPLKYNHPGLTVDLGVGLWAWPLPMDIDGDGDLDMVVNCPDVPSNGVWVFENPGGNTKMPAFKPARRLSKGLQNIMVSYVQGEPRVLGVAQEYPDFKKTGLELPTKLSVPANPHPGAKVRANQWRYVDYDGDGRLDLTIGLGDWLEYGWDNAFNPAGEWTRGPLHGYVYLLRNTSDDAAKPQYAAPVALQAAGKPIDNFGQPSQCFEDFDGDGDLDLLCGEFLDGFTYHENIGTRTAPVYAAAQRLLSAEGRLLHMDLEMIVVTPIDWDKDGDIDLVVGDEDGRVAFIENLGGNAAGQPPRFAAPRYFQQEADDLKFGALVTPVGVDWDGDGLQDLICGNSAGYIGFFKNLGGTPPKWAAPVRLQAAGQTIRLQAGPNGSIQGPAEAKWGYTTQTVADWDGDGLLDLVVNSIWGKVLWYRNVGTKTAPELAAAQPLEVAWEGPTPKPAWVWWQPFGKELVTQWRTTPMVYDLDEDGVNDLVMLDQEGYLAWFRQVQADGVRQLLPPQRVFRSVKGSSFDADGKPVQSQAAALRLNGGQAGGSGRRKLHLVDFDGDGLVDLFANGKNADFFRGIASPKGEWHFTPAGPIAERKLAGHDTSPTTVDWDKDGKPELVLGAEDGKLYWKAPAKE